MYRIYNYTSAMRNYSLHKVNFKCERRQCGCAEGVTRKLIFGWVDSKTKK